MMQMPTWRFYIANVLSTIIWPPALCFPAGSLHAWLMRKMPMEGSVRSRRCCSASNGALLDETPETLKSPMASWGNLPLLQDST
jgi:hypothetical protein